MESGERSSYLLFEREFPALALHNFKAVVECLTVVEFVVVLVVLSLSDTSLAAVLALAIPRTVQHEVIESRRQLVRGNDWRQPVVVIWTLFAAVYCKFFLHSPRALLLVLCIALGCFLELR